MGDGEKGMFQPYQLTFHSLFHILGRFLGGGEGSGAADPAVFWSGPRRKREKGEGGGGGEW